MTESKDFKFDVVIGNPPYQDESIGNSTSAPPIYDQFMDAAYKVGNKVELITPARFLFDAGSTPKSWNRKMLNDEHLKVLYFKQDSAEIFPGTDIKGGIAVTYRDSSTDFGPIGTFTSFDELNTILKKVEPRTNASLKSIFLPQTKVNREIDSAFPSERRMRPNWFDKFPDIFTRQQDSDHSILIIGLTKGNKRVERYVTESIIDDKNIDKYKVFVPKANGSGKLGEPLSTPILGKPFVGCTGTFLQIGCFSQAYDAENCLKYIMTKFARTMLGILKITQDNPPSVWDKVPLQDFTKSSDINWSRAVADIDQQLYIKYGLSQHEIDFIETHVKEMA